MAVSIVGCGVLFGGADPVVRGRGWDRRGCEFPLSLFLLLFGEEIVRSVGWRLQTPVLEAFLPPVDAHALAVADDDIAGADGVEREKGSASSDVTSDLGWGAQMRWRPFALGVEVCGSGLVDHLLLVI